jgi:hypothetical protein
MTGVGIAEFVPPFSFFEWCRLPLLRINIEPAQDRTFFCLFLVFDRPFFEARGSADSSWSSSDVSEPEPVDDERREEFIE